MDFVLPLLSLLVPPVFFTLILGPRLEKMRSTLDQFSKLRISVPDTRRYLNGPPITEVSQLERDRENVRREYNRLYREYAQRYAEFIIVGRVFILIVVSIAPLLALKLTSDYYRVVAVVGLYTIFWLLIAYVKPQIAPTPDELASIDYVAEHFGQLDYRSLMRLGQLNVYFTSLTNTGRILDFHIRMFLPVFGFKYLFAVTDREHKRFYVCSYGTASSCIHVIEESAEIFAIPVGKLDFDLVPEPKPELKMTLWVFLPVPKSWKRLGDFDRPSLLENAVTVREFGNLGFCLDSDVLSLDQHDETVAFIAKRSTLGFRKWTISTDVSANPMVKRFGSKLARRERNKTIVHPRGKALTD